MRSSRYTVGGLGSRAQAQKNRHCMIVAVVKPTIPFQNGQSRAMQLQILESFQPEINDCQTVLKTGEYVRDHFEVGRDRPLRRLKFIKWLGANPTYESVSMTPDLCCSICLFGLSIFLYNKRNIRVPPPDPWIDASKSRLQSRQQRVEVCSYQLPSSLFSCVLCVFANRSFFALFLSCRTFTNRLKTWLVAGRLL